MRHLLTLISKRYRQQQAIKARLARIQSPYLCGHHHGYGYHDERDVYIIVCTDCQQIVQREYHGLTI